ncbi:hypothetical protein GCM10022253_24790 [Sphingomonas endophytica]
MQHQHRGRPVWHHRLQRAPRAVRQQTATNRAHFFHDVTRLSFGYSRGGAEVKEGVRRNWWRQGIPGSVLAHTPGIKAFSETDTPTI